MKKPITKAQHLQLIGLQALAVHHSKALDDIRDAVADVLGITDEAGDISDFLYADRDIKWLVERHGMTVPKR